MDTVWIDATLKGGSIILALLVLLQAWQASKAETVSEGKLSLINKKRCQVLNFA